MSGESVTIQQLENEIEELTKKLQEKKELLSVIKTREVRNYIFVLCYWQNTRLTVTFTIFPLQAKKSEGIKSVAVDIPRYSRQIILPFVGLKGESKTALKIWQTSVSTAL